MAVTITPIIIDRFKVNNRRCVIADLALSGTYVTAGTAVDPGYFGLYAVNSLLFLDGTGVTLAPKYTPSTTMLQLYRSGTGNGVQTDIFPFVKASTVAANDVAGTTAFSTVATVLGANYTYVVTTVAAHDKAAAAATIALQPDVARNLTVCINNVDGGTVAAVASNYVIVGTFNGAVVTETIAFTTTPSMANGKMILKSGAQPFDTITSITPSANQAAGFWHSVGIGGLLGLSRTLLTPATTDVLAVTNAGVASATADIAALVTATAGAQCVKLATIAADKSHMIKYMCGGSEWGSGASVGTPTYRVMAIGV